MMVSLDDALDVNGDYPITWDYDPPTHKWQITLNPPDHTQATMITHLCEGLVLQSGDTQQPLQHTLRGLQAELSGDAHAALLLHTNAICRVSYRDDSLHRDNAEYDRLSVFELRMLASFAHQVLPYPRNVLQGLTMRLRTDLHTHLSSQIAAHDLLHVAAQAGAYYPLSLLTLLGISSSAARHSMPSTPFTPTRREGLDCEQPDRMVEGIAVSDLITDESAMTALTRAMTIGSDEVLTFDELERRVYRARNPLTKNPAVIHDSIMAVARDYARQGIAYAELAVTAALDPDWLAVACPALMQAEAQTGVMLRLLAGVPRSLSPMQALSQLASVMFIAQHPMIVGVDFLGYEANKTRNFGWALTQMARFAAAQRRGYDRANRGWHCPDDFIIRVHAGENGKNPDNVAEVMEIAAQYGVRVRIGHAAYGDVAASLSQAKKLAERALLILEFNPDSNMAMNNIDDASQLPVVQWAQAGIPFVIASDGAGIYQTDSRQLLAAATFAGLTDTHMALCAHTEAAHMARQQHLFTQKQRAFQARYGDDKAFMQAYRHHVTSRAASNGRDALSGLTPLLIAGASGSSWQRIAAEMQREITIGLHMLVALLDPAHIVFAMGRVKDEGLGRILDDALDARLHASPQAAPFNMVGMLSQHQNMPTLAHNINHIVELAGELMSVPTEMTRLLAKHQGCALYIGGSAFTRDFITCSQRHAIPFGVMDNVEGASSQKARILPQHHVFNGAIGMVRHVQAMMGDQAFMHPVSDGHLTQLYNSVTL